MGWIPKMELMTSGKRIDLCLSVLSLVASNSLAWSIKSRTAAWLEKELSLWFWNRHKFDSNSVQSFRLLTIISFSKTSHSLRLSFM